jgi:hypothetical protein
LHEVASSLGIAESTHNWDFGFQYEWGWAPDTKDNQLTADREVSYRQWSAGVPFAGYWVRLPFEFPTRGQVAAYVGIGRDGDLVVGDNEDLPWLGYTDEVSSGWSGMQGAYKGCWLDAGDDMSNAPDELSHTKAARTTGWQDMSSEPGLEMADFNLESSRAYCASICDGYMYMGLQWAAGCVCGNTYGRWGKATSSKCTNNGNGNPTNNGGWGSNSVYQLVSWALQPSSTAAGSRGTCWLSLPALVPMAHNISEAPEAAASSQGANYLSKRFCPGWAKFIAPAACDPADVECSGADASGSAIFDGGGDMYDLGNVLSTSLMGDCTSDAHSCPLGSLRYRGDFVHVDTNCFGPNGFYQMMKLDYVWVFLSHNSDNTPIDFMITGNLGSDGSGTVTDYNFEATPYIGFIKRECGVTDDPSVNHLVVLESTSGQPGHSCDYTNGGSCHGASSDLDDDIFSGITPGSPILYLLYASRAGYCIKEDEHRAIFDAAVSCLSATRDPFQAAHEDQRSKLLAEADVDDQHHVVFGGSAQYWGALRGGSPRRVLGPGGFDNGIQFSARQWMQLGELGIDVQQGWTLDCYACFSSATLAALHQDQVLISGTDGAAVMKLASPADGKGWLLGTYDIGSVTDGWHHVAVMETFENRTCFIDGQLVSTIYAVNRQVGDSVSATIHAFGNNADGGSSSFAIPIYRLRLYTGAVAPADLFGHTESFALMEYHAKNSRWVQVSAGADAIQVTWDTFGWDAVAHEQVHITLDPTGELVAEAENTSALWDRAVGSCSGVSNHRHIGNWTSAALLSSARGSQLQNRLQVKYLDSDPCYHIWDGLTCSLSGWPVGADDCGNKLSCADLGWGSDVTGSISVCGASALRGRVGSTDTCVRESTFIEAQSLCAELGSRLCTVDELERAEGRPEQCDYDTMLTWSWAHSEVKDAACGTLAWAGEAGAWYEFSPLSTGMYEIQLRTDSGSDTFAFSTDIIGSDGESITTAMQPTVYRRPGGVMLRLNLTLLEIQYGPYYVYITSTEVNMPYSIAMAVPATYKFHTMQMAPGQDEHPAGKTHALNIRTSGAELIELPWPFIFYGLNYSRAWVTSAGYLTFEQSNEADALSGAHNVRSAILASAGEFDLDRTGASVTTSSPELHTFKISWHAPLYNNTIFTDVDITLQLDGTIVVHWDRVELSDTSSLAYRLLCWYTFDRVHSNQIEDASDHKTHSTVSSNAVSTSRKTAFRVDTINMCEPPTHLPHQGFVTPVTNLTDDYGDGLDCTMVITVPDQYHIRLVIERLQTEALFDFLQIFDGASVEAPEMQLEGTGTTVPSIKNTGSTVNTVERCCQIPNYERKVKSRGIQTDICDDDFPMQCGHLASGAPNPDFLNFCGFSGSQVGHAPILMSSSSTVTLRFSSDCRITQQLGFIVSYEKFCPLGVECTSSDPESNGVAPSAQDESLLLFGDEFVQLGPLTYGRHLSVSAWIKLPSVRLWLAPSGCPQNVNHEIDHGDWDQTSIDAGLRTESDWCDLGSESFALFSSFESTECGDSDACRNAANGRLDSGGWVAIGSTAADNDPSQLWIPNTVYESQSADSFWEAAEEAWMMATMIISDLSVRVYVSGVLHLIGSRTVALSRYTREGNYIGAAQHTPFDNRGAGWIAISDFRLWDRALSPTEIAALSKNAIRGCCTEAGIRDPFGVDDIDLTPLVADRSTVVISAQHPNINNILQSDKDEPFHQDCGRTQAARLQKVDICADIAVLSDCQGVIGDGIGAYAASEDCGIHIEGLVGWTYTLTFEEFETEDGWDFVSVYDGKSSNAPQLGHFSGSRIPAAINASGSDIFLRFKSNENRQKAGFQAVFACHGAQNDPWRPSDVATVLRPGLTIDQLPLVAMRTACLSDALLPVQCCADASIECATARTTGLALQRRQLRGSIPEALGNLGALRWLKLHDNFLHGTLPVSLSQLHRLRELQLSHNQFDMQTRDTLSELLANMLDLKTLDMGMSSEKEALERSIMRPAPPLSCRVGASCSFLLFTRTATGLQLPHGGLQMRVGSAAKTSELCDDQMDGTYVCRFPYTWTAISGEFEFSLSADGEDFVPIRTVVDPTNGAISTVSTYPEFAVTVSPIVCTALHSLPKADGSICICEEGFFRREFGENEWSCERCQSGKMPVDAGTRCEACPFGQFSRDGTSCGVCPPGSSPNIESGAYDCTDCPVNSISTDGSDCARCDHEQISNPSRTACVCPPQHYNSSRYGRHAVQCVPKNLRTGNLDAPSVCTTCDDLECTTCNGADLAVSRPGWGRTGAPSTWLVFRCPFQHACINTNTQRCATGHTGVLCAVCEVGYGLASEKCVECKAANQWWYGAAALACVATACGVAYLACCRPVEQPDSVTMTSEHLVQLTDNPLQPERVRKTPRGSFSQSARATVQRSSNIYLMLRVLYQPVRILVGYIQVMDYFLSAIFV